MTGPLVLFIMMLMMPIALILWNKNRIKGKMLCYILKDDKSVTPKLCELRDDFVIYENYAFDVCPDLVRVARFPTGWPSFVQELVPCALYDIKNALPLNWINLKAADYRSMEVRSALDENWLRKLVHEAATEGAPQSGGFGKINWKKVLPIMLLVGGVIGFIVISRMGGGGIFGMFGGG